jgi:hypothetical protein
MILDDVFVNFDAGRTRTACAVLREFAKQGHQLLVFTCHEHVWRMFQDIKVDCRRIPNRHGDNQEVEDEWKADARPEPEPELVTASVQSAPQELVAPEPQLVMTKPAPNKVKPKVKRRVEPPVKATNEDIKPPPDVPVKPKREPALNEIEYWWESPTRNGSNGSSQSHVDDSVEDWLPEHEIWPRPR